MENDHKVLHRDAGQHSPLSVEEMRSLGCQGGQAAPSEGENRSLDVASSGQPTRYWWDGGGCSFFFFFCTTHLCIQSAQDLLMLSFLRHSFFNLFFKLFSWRFVQVLQTDSNFILKGVCQLD